MFIDQLLDQIKSLEEGVLAVKKSSSQPFSFFRESFEKTQKIAGLLHDFESMQIDDLRSQMERLVQFLSDRDSGVVNEPGENRVEAIGEPGVEENRVEAIGEPGVVEERVEISGASGVEENRVEEGGEE